MVMINLGLGVDLLAENQIQLCDGEGKWHWIMIIAF